VSMERLPPRQKGQPSPNYQRPRPRHCGQGKAPPVIPVGTGYSGTWYVPTGTPFGPDLSEGIPGRQGSRHPGRPVLPGEE
jgi:hypothetical protein